MSETVLPTSDAGADRVTGRVAERASDEGAATPVAESGDPEAARPASAGRHRAHASAGHTRSRNSLPRRGKPWSPTYLIAVGVTVAAIPAGLMFTGGDWAGALAAVGVAVGAVLAGVGTVAAGVRLGMRWTDYRP